MGHELQHGFNRHAKLKSTRTFLDDIRQQAGAKGPVHDYTDELRAYIQAGREDEAKAEIAGWNALLSLEKQHNPRAGLVRSEEHTSELQSLMRISYAVFCLKKKNTKINTTHDIDQHHIENQNKRKH